jgi:hypothetical protein
MRSILRADQNAWREKLRPLKRAVETMWYRCCVILIQPANYLLHFMCRQRVRPRSVLHVSGMVHVPWQTTRLLRRHGWTADYLAIGRSPIWDQADYCRVPKTIWWDAFDEFIWLWRVAARYEIVHLHFMITVTRIGWELAWLKRMGRFVVVHWRGCEIRDREKNMMLHPEINLCQQCDYDPRPCQSIANQRRRSLAARYGDCFLATTPDLLDFAPQATHLPFFHPEVEPQPVRQRPSEEPLRLAHVTVHPGLEGTDDIRRTVERLQRKGRRIIFQALSWVRPQEVLSAFAEADLAIGKMKMGYYANAQIESMVMGVPTITYVRPELMTAELQNSGFIFSTLQELENTLEHYLDHPEELARKRAIARLSILRIHENDVITRQLATFYDDLKSGRKPEKLFRPSDKKHEACPQTPKY